MRRALALVLVLLAVPRLVIAQTGGPVTANQGTANLTPWNTQVPDVASSQAISTTTCTASTSNQTGCVVVAAQGRDGFAVSWSTASTFVGVVVAEASNDAGATWAATFFDAPATSSKTATVSPASGVAGWYSIIPVGGATYYRVRATTATSGSGTFTMSATAGIDPSMLSASPNNGSTPPTVIADGAEVQNGAQPTTATAGNMRRIVASTDGVLYARLGGPVYFTCSFNGIAATLTQLTGCGGAGAGLKYYITDIAIQTTTTTSGTYAFQTGTGTNCGTGTTAFFPSSSTSNRFNAVITSNGMPGLSFMSPLVTGANVEVCVIGVATNTVSGQISGFIAP